MKTMNKKRVLLISCSVIMLCLCIIAGMSYALFTDSVTVSNHLQAGNLHITLTRTELQYSILSVNGELDTITVEEDLDLTTSTDDECNVFGIDSNDVRIVPGSYFDAELEIKNDGNTAFNYSVSIKRLDGTMDLADQLKVIVTHPDGSRTEKMLSELTGDLSIAAGRMKKTDSVQTFRVRVEFVNDADYNVSHDEDARINNNDVQSGTAVFDLIVTAEQALAQNE